MTFYRSALLSLCLMSALSSPVWAASPTPSVASSNYDFTVQYDVYAGGMHLIDVTQQFTLSDTSYSSTMTAKPTGFFSKIVPWEGQYTTKGLVNKDGKLIPQRHAKTSRWGDERDETIMSFDAGGQLIRMTDREWVYGKTRPAPQNVTPDKSLSRNALDLVTTVLRMLQHAQTTSMSTKAACNNSDIVFDGKRRFSMNFTGIGIETLPATNYSPFKGKAPRCEIEVKPLAGFNGKKRGFYKIQEDSRAQGELPSLWLLPAWANGGPPIPVRMRIKSEYGAIMVHATKVVRK
ncbi:MAG TPA: DUF3108 domain-containing protein [Alphaproteobacteria bacterium]